MWRNFTSVFQRRKWEVYNIEILKLVKSITNRKIIILGGIGSYEQFIRS